ncbi:uncharacterized protein LOC143020555 isoform X2 [Oratosquilla oratoria]|uniref:uncharacterized protein LOC143020555 isoform X2 n=1 Tax=Oratosquilla oratoria TaxID=337810 RepID=UPI003F760A60
MDLDTGARAEFHSGLISHHRKNGLAMTGSSPSYHSNLHSHSMIVVDGSSASSEARVSPSTTAAAAEAVVVLRAKGRLGGKLHGLLPYHLVQQRTSDLSNASSPSGVSSSSPPPSSALRVPFPTTTSTPAMSPTRHQRSVLVNCDENSPPGAVDSAAATRTLQTMTSTAPAAADLSNYTHALNCVTKDRSFKGQHSVVTLNFQNSGAYSESKSNFANYSSDLGDMDPPSATPYDFENNGYDCSKEHRSDSGGGGGGGEGGGGGKVYSVTCSSGRSFGAETPAAAAQLKRVDLREEVMEVVPVEHASSSSSSSALRVKKHHGALTATSPAGANPGSAAASKSLAQTSKPLPKAPSATSPKAKAKRRCKKMKSSDPASTQKICGVCGDIAKSNHFGGPACDSCKAFFRRSVQSSAWESFKCSAQKQCEMFRGNRKSCQYCRFKKCQDNGMEVGWVMSESDRMAMLKNRLAKQRQLREEREKDAIYGTLPHKLNEEDARRINSLIHKIHHTFGRMPYPQECMGDSVDALSNIFVWMCKRLGKFFFDIDSLEYINKDDVSLLMQTGIAMSLYIQGAHMFDPEGQIWPHDSCNENVKMPHVTVNTLRRMVGLPEAFNSVMNFYKKYEAIMKDEPVAVLFGIIAFFTADNPLLKHPEKVQAVQDEYIGLLCRYMRAKENEAYEKKLLGKLVYGLGDLRGILEFHSQVDISPTITHEVMDKPLKKGMLANHIQLINQQIEEALSNSFSPYSSILTQEEKVMFSSPSSTVAVRCRKTPTKQPLRFHPSLKGLGISPRTDMILINPLECIRHEGPKALTYTSSAMAVTPSKRTKDAEEKSQTPYISSMVDSSELRTTGTTTTSCSKYLIGRGSIRGSNQSAPDAKKDVEALKDILKRISNTSDTIKIEALKKGVPSYLWYALAQKISSS